MHMRYSMLLLTTLVTILAFSLSGLSWAAPAASPTTPGTWQLQWHGSDDLTSIDAVGPQRAWAVGKNGHLLRTTNGGQTWFYQQAAPAADVEAVDFSDTTTGWAAGASGNIWQTTNGGITWTSQSSPTPNRLLALAFTDAQNGWAAGNTGTIVHTTDGGTTWTVQPSGTAVTLNGLVALDATRAWVVGNAGTILATTNGGATWSPQTSGTVLTLHDVAFTSPLNGWTVGENGVLRTTNGGASWAPQPIGEPRTLFAISFSSTQQGWLAGGQGAAWTTSDGGATWTNVPTGQTQNIADLATPADGDVWTAGAGHLILRKQDSGPFTIAAPPAPAPADPDYPGFLGVDAVDANTVYVVGGDAQILKSTDGGASWRLLDGVAQQVTPIYPNNPWLRGVRFPIDASTGWVSGRYGLLFRTSDGGATWTQQYARLANGDVHTGFLWFVQGYDNQHAMTAGKDGYVFRTSDGGSTWLFSNVAYMSINIRDASYATPNDVYGVAAWDSFVTSRNGGASWVRTYPGTGADFLDGVDFPDVNHGWISGSGGVIRRTTDGAATWAVQTGSTTQHLFNLDMTDLQTGWIVGDLGTILWTTNGGATWNPQTSPNTAALKWIDMVDDTRGWAVGTEGTIIRYSTAPPTPTPTATATSTPTATPTPQAGTGHLAGTIFHDLNGNGQRDSGEPGLPGATVEVRLSNGTLVSAVASDALGFYVFRNLTAQTYEVAVSAPPGYVSVVGTNPANVAVVAGQTVVRDFPMVLLPPTPTPTPTATPNVTTVQRQITAGLDDTHQRVTTGYNDLGALTVRMGRVSGYVLLSGFRFANVQVPSHVRIIDARLDVNRTYHAGTDPVSLAIRAAAQDNVPNFQAQPPLAAPTTQASTAWVIESSVPAGWLSSPNLAGLVQEVVDRAGWQPGNALALLLASDASNTGYVDAVSYDANPVNAARLRVDYAACLAADVDCSCDVAVKDVQLVAAHWGMTSSSPGWHPEYDLVADGVIDAADIAAAASAWGQWGC